MRILILWRQEHLSVRNTIIDHAFSFERYDMENEYFYFDIYHGRYAEDYAWIEPNMFDAVIFHNTALGLRWFDKFWTDYVSLMEMIWSDYKCKKILLVQDDYTLTERIWNFANRINADTIYSVLRKEDYPIIYPKGSVSNINVKTVLTGYVENKYINKINLKPHKEREYDVVYRAKKLPYHYGKQGQLKYEIIEIFLNKLIKTNLKYDIKCTNEEANAILGDAWFEFLANSRLTIGCLSGAGIADFNGSLHDCVMDYVKINKDASFEETREKCFPQQLDNLHGAVSPRIFECAITKTCQVLVGDDYQGVLIPNIDYIVLDEDFGNLDEVIEMMKDINYCEQIADSCYRNVVESGKYSYQTFVDRIVGDLKQNIQEKPKSKELSYKIREKCKINNEKVLAEMK